MLERSARMWFFYLKHVKGKRGKLSFNITRATCEYLADPLLLVHVTSTFLCFFGTSAWGPQVRLSTQIQADFGSKWVVLEKGRVFCCGGFTDAAYILERTGLVEQKANMNEARHSHGLLAASHLYVFGGYEQNTCEKLELPKNEWSILPCMKEARTNFNPCMFVGIVYLGGSRYMEAFNPQTDTFLAVQIPLSEDSDCCLYVHHNLLVVHSYSYILKFAVAPDGQLAQQMQLRSQENCMYQNSQPLLDQENEVFYIIQDGKCISFYMETGILGKITIE